MVALPLRSRLLLFFTIAMPFALAALLSIGRYGGEHRAAAEAALTSTADSLLHATRNASELIARAEARGLAASLYTQHSAPSTQHFPNTQHSAPSTQHSFDRQFGTTGPERIGRNDAEQLQKQDRTITVAPIDGRTTVLAPLKDSLQWETRGALLLADRARAPAAFPPLALAAGLLALLLASFAAAAYARAPHSLRALATLVPGVAFLAWLAALPVAPGGGAYRMWATAALAAWLVLAAVGLSLLRLTQRPLDQRLGVAAWGFLAPSFAHLLLFSVGPILFSLWLSFHDWDLIAASRPFVGLANYQALAADAEFWHAVRNTAVYVLFVPIGMVVALALALLLNRGLPGERLLRAVFFLPYITSFVAISLIWKWMYDPDVGLLNAILRAVGLPEQPWLSSPASALPSLMVMSIWMYCGYMMILFLAGLQSIPETLYESARMDGASAWQRFRRITLPMLRPTTFFVLVTMIIFMFQVFTAVYVMTEGGPLHATDVIVYHIYRNAWEYLRLGYASAMAWVLFAIVFVITLVQFRFLGRGRTEW